MAATLWSGCCSCVIGRRLDDPFGFVFTDQLEIDDIEMPSSTKARMAASGFAVNWIARIARRFLIPSRQ